MIRSFNKKLEFIVLLTTVLSANAVAQTTDEMAPLRTRLETYNNNVLEEKIFVHTDKHLYQSGDIMWLKVYCVDSRQNKPLNLSKVAYIELLDNQNRQVMLAKVALDSGFGAASVVIPSTLPTGNYRLRSYTHWMKNFSENFFYRQDITVTNGRRILPETKVPQPEYNAEFFPEGGHAVKGLESKIAVKVTDQYGKSADFMGFIVDQKKDTVVRFQPLVFGMGSFRFTPETGNSYQAVIKFPDGSLQSSAFEAIENEGYVMSVSNDEDGNIEVKLNSNISNASKLYVLVHTRLSLKIAEMVKLVNGQGIVKIREKGLGEGVSTITVFNASREPVCERLYFKQPSKIKNLTVKTDQADYQNRKKINLDVSSSDTNQGNFSLAVYQVDSAFSKEFSGISEWLWLRSELKGRVEHPEFYFDEKEPNRKPALENLLLTQGWRRFDWKSPNTVPAFTFEPEYNGVIVSARIIDSRNGAPAPRIQGFIGAPGSRTNFVSGISNDSGYLKLEMPDLYGSSELVLQTNSLNGDSVYRVDIIQPYAEKPETDSITPLIITAADTSGILDRMISTQVQSVYKEEELNRFDTLSIDTTTFYTRPDKRYYLDDYTRFTTMEEVLREYVQWVNVKKQADNFHLTVYDEERKVIMSDDPLVLMDGVPVFRINKVLELNPLKMQKLDVIAKKYVLGNTSFDGILNFVSFNGDLEGLTLDRNATVVDYDGLQLKREFYSPVYNGLDSTVESIPDFRTTLYWNPEVKLKNGTPVNFSFYSGDLKGNYIVVLEGLSGQGVSGEAVTRFTVK
ncbi:hypothetical protein [Pollutibacter soli]|uniref:hypothetical protein n=1 Tax=Pollutibacter soli TaxID=3034157 RepID=UPI003013D750